MWRYVRILILEKMLDFNCACSIQIIASKHTNHNLWKPSVHTFLFISCFLSLSIQTAVKLSEWVSFSQALLRLYRVQLMRKRRQSFGGASFRRNSCSRIDRNLISLAGELYWGYRFVATKYCSDASLPHLISWFTGRWLTVVDSI